MFKPGQSGNPAGRAPGTGKVNEYRKLLESKLPELVDTLVSKALEGYPAALRLCFERLIPAYRTETMPVEIPAMQQTTSLVEIGRSVLSAIGEGLISPEIGAQVLNALGNQSKLIESEELEKRIEQLESNAKQEDDNS